MHTHGKLILIHRYVYLVCIITKFYRHGRFRGFSKLYSWTVANFKRLTCHRPSSEPLLPSFFGLSKELVTSKFILLPWSAITCTTIMGEVPVKGSECSPRTILALIIGLFNGILNDCSSLFRSVSSSLLPHLQFRFLYASSIDFIWPVGNFFHFHLTRNRIHYQQRNISLIASFKFIWLVFYSIWRDRSLCNEIFLILRIRFFVSFFLCMPSNMIQCK